MIMKVEGEENIRHALKGLGWAFRVTQLVKYPPAMQETPVQFLGREVTLEKR